MKALLIIIGLFGILFLTRGFDINPVCFEVKRLRDNPREQERWERVKVETPELLEKCRV